MIECFKFNLYFTIIEFLESKIDLNKINLFLTIKLLYSNKNYVFKKRLYIVYKIGIDNIILGYFV